MSSVTSLSSLGLHFLICKTIPLVSIIIDSWRNKRIRINAGVAYGSYNPFFCPLHSPESSQLKVLAQFITCSMSVCYRQISKIKTTNPLLPMLYSTSTLLLVTWEPTSSLWRKNETFFHFSFSVSRFRNDSSGGSMLNMTDFVETQVKVVMIRCWINLESFHFSSVQSLSRVWLFATPWIAARQVSLSFTIS